MQRKQFNIKREFVRRRDLNLAGLKIGPTQAYLNAYVIREGEGDGNGPVRHYALTEEEACTWADEQTGAKAEATEETKG